MVDSGYVSEYFRKKASKWRTTSGTVEKYVHQKGKGGLRVEFQNDPDFKQVCLLINEIAKEQGRPDFYTYLEKILGDLIGVPISDVLDIIAGAAVEACNNSALGADLISKGLTALVISVIGAIILAAIFSD